MRFERERVLGKLEDCTGVTVSRGFNVRGYSMDQGGEGKKKAKI